MVTGGVSWQLHGIGTAMNDPGLEAFCGHTHSEECYEKVLVCPDETHSHTEECYDRRLICGMEEAPPGSNVLTETQQQWESTLPETLSGVWREDTAAVARSQLGYRDSAAQFTAAEDGLEHCGYTRYGAWYGNPWGEWNTMFVYFCLHYGGVPEEIIPYGSGCWAWSLKLEEKGLLAKPGDVLPQQGDILLYDDDLDGKADHSGIVKEIADENGTETIFTIEGNVNGQVAECGRPADDESIIGYLLLEQEDLSETLPEAEEDPVIRFSGFSESGVAVNVSAPEGAFPEDTVMEVTDISDEDACQTAAESYGTDPAEINAVAVDISFIAPDGTELEPDSLVKVTIALPEEKRLAGQDLGLLHVTDEGQVIQMDEAQVTTVGAFFETDSFSTYILTSGGNVEITQYFNDANNGDRTLYVPVGGSFTITYTNAPGGVGGDYHTWIDDTSILEKGDVSYQGDSTIITFNALKSGSTVIHSRTQQPSTVNVVVEQPLFIKTAINDRDIDRVNEWLPAVAIPEKKDGYIPNVLNSQNGRFHPYLLTVGDPLVIYSPVSEGQNLSLVVQGLDLSKQYYNGYDHYTYRGTHDNDILNVVSTESPEGTVGAHYVAAKAGYAQILVVDGSKVVRTMYVEVKEPHGRMLDHADIEIADGGKYTSSKVVRQADGTLVKTVKVYDSYVLDVNESILYQSQDNSTPCQFYHDDNGQQPYAPEENRHGYRTEDYWVDSSIAPSSPQYELTSKYNLEIQPNYWSDKKFYVGEVDHVVFDVKLGLDPLEERTYTKVDGVWVLTGTKSCSGEDTEIKDSVQFRMEHQDVIDAYNKCPDHSGLDFTIMASSAMLEFEVTKTMAGKQIQEGDFTFEVIDDAGNVISTATNNAEGIVSFEGIHFEKPGQVTYHIREVNDGKFTDVQYSTEELSMVIDVTTLNPQTGEMFAEIIDPSDMNFDITNHREYQLPETGGTGTVPYTILGTSMILTALLLFVRKRKGVSLSDSIE